MAVFKHGAIVKVSSFPKNICFTERRNYSIESNEEYHTAFIDRNSWTENLKLYENPKISGNSRNSSVKLTNI